MWWQRTHRRFTVETSLRKAIADGDMEVWLQPIVDIESGRVVSFEALSRWGLTSPAEFIPTAEESGLILRLGDRVLEYALSALTRIHEDDGDVLWA